MQNTRCLFVQYQRSRASSYASSHDVTQKQVMITCTNFYDTELIRQKSVMIKNIQSVTYFLKMSTHGSKFALECSAGQCTVSYKKK